MTALESTTDAINGNQAISAASFYGLGGDASMVHHIHIKWDSTLAATITIESTDFPPAEVLTNDVVAGNWVQENPPTGYTAISAGATAATPLVLSIAGGTAGGASMSIGNIGCKRLRAKVVCTVAGQLRIRTNGKQ